MKTAKDIAVKSLKQCYDTKGIVAGRTHYNSIWARDALYACWGSLIINDVSIVKSTIKTFLKHTRADGLVPIRYGASNVAQWLELIKIKPRKKIAVYNQDKGFNPALDPNLLLIITIEKYCEKTKDYDFAKQNLKKIHLIFDWLEKQEVNGLIHGGKYSTWQDIIKKEGAQIYSNVLYYKAILSLENILKNLKIKNEFLTKAIALKENINKSFWDENLGHYIDFFNKNKRSKVFTSDGNFLSIIFDLANKNQTESILTKADEFNISKDVPSYTNYPKYGFGEVYTPLYLIGMQDYNDYGICWTWIGCIHALALKKANKVKIAKKVLNKLSNIFLKDQTVHETYEQNGKKVNRMFYKSESPFAWTAGLFILADKEVNKDE